MNKQAFFARQLAKWLVEIDWHYNTLLSASIQCTTELPNDGNVLINELLLCYPVKPSQSSITEFLLSSKRLTRWFNGNLIAPTISRYALRQA